MKNKIRRIAFAATSVAMAVPVVCGAQFQKPPSTGLPDQGIYNIIQNIMNWLLMAVGIIGVIGFAIAGILYLTAAGDDDRIGTAKKAMLYSIVGVVVALAGLVALNFASGLLGAQTKF